ncbi:MAG: hypothetical protein IJN58_08870 [Clostridia bacterium]|nr:hypothetical protein [Clostridia bacterium]
MKPLATRQVHLDFHTSPLIPGIGEHFSKENFQAALKEGHLSSITIFAKCHHGLCYYPTKVGTMHPGLSFDLLGEMIEAAHEIGVRAPVYITGGWSDHDSKTRPEWRAKNQDGSFMRHGLDPNAAPNDFRPHNAWDDMCLNDGSYAEHIYALTHEVCQRYKNLDGLFYDIIFVYDACFCDECKAGMIKMGLNPESLEDARKYNREKHCEFMRKCGEILHSYHPDATIFFNSGGAEMNMPEYHFGSTHFEMEDLPTDWGGYDKMPVRARFFANTGKDYLGMTGKFHTSWGEFGGFKFADAMKYEAASMLAYGARCSIGDQLHPNGEMNADTYKLIGEAYRYVEEIEKYAFPAKPTAKIGIYLSDSTPSNEGLAKMLLESQTDFDIIYQDNYDPFDLVIFPDAVTLAPASLEALKAFIARGGKVIFSGESLVENGSFQIDAGITYVGPNGCDKDFIRVGDKIAKNMVTAPFLCYSPAQKVTLSGAEALSEVVYPYFNRTYEHFCSHKNTPYDLTKETTPGMTLSGNVLYIAHPIFKIYREYGSLYHKRYFLNALAILKPEKPLSVSLMSAGRATMAHQPQESRYCAHLLYASPVNRGAVEVLEDMPDLYNIPVTVKVPEEIKSVTCITEKQDIPFTKDENGVHFTLPHLRCHALVALNY